MLRASFCILILLYILSPVIAQEDSVSDFIQASITDSAPYVGEPVIYTVRIYDAGTTVGKRYIPPVFDGFGQLVLPPLPSVTQSIDGRRYTVTSQDTVLYPNRAGDFRIEAARLVIDRESGLSVSSDELTISVQALPPDPPPSFRNAVGQFNMDVRVVSQNINAGEILDLEVSITGGGNINQILMPSLVLEDSWRTVDMSSMFLRETPLYGERRFRWLIQSSFVGQMVLEPLVFSYFDPILASYVTLTGPVIELNITGDIPSDLLSDTDVLVPDLEFKSVPAVSYSFSAIFWIIWLVPLFLLLVAFVPLVLRLRSGTKVVRLQPDRLLNRARLVNSLPPDQRVSEMILIVDAYLSQRAINSSESNSHRNSRVIEFELLRSNLVDIRYAPLSNEDLSVLLNRLVDALS